MSFMSEFKEFATKGNVMDLAVGVIIGAAFGKIVGSAVDDLIMPIVGRVVGKVDFSNLYVPLAAIPEGVPNTLVELKKAGVPVLAYGNFITILINFIILAFIIFVIIKQMNRLKREAPPAPPPLRRKTWSCSARSATHSRSKLGIARDTKETDTRIEHTPGRISPWRAMPTKRHLANHRFRRVLCVLQQCEKRYPGIMTIHASLPDTSIPSLC